MLRKRCVLAVLVLLLAVGCALGEAFRKVPEWTPKQRAIYAEGLYIRQWDSYVSKIAYASGMTAEAYANIVQTDPVKAKEIADAANLTEEERKLLRVKKSVLSKMEVALDVYEAAINAGQVPGPELEQQLMDLTNKLEQWVLEQNL